MRNQGELSDFLTKDVAYFERSTFGAAPERKPQREMDDIDGAIGAAPERKPQGHEQRSLYG